MRLQAEKIKKNLRFPVAVHLYDSIDSTNDEAKRRHTPGGYHLYAAQHQTAGRGRRGHSFYSPKDTGLYMTLALPFSGCPAGIQKITCAAAVAVCEAVEALAPLHPQIKWVNDIVLDGKKTAGILTELLLDEKNQPVSVIVGIGLNLCTTQFPGEFADKAGNLGELEPNALCGMITENLITLFGSLDDNSIIEKYKLRNNCIGREVSFTLCDGVHTAKAVDIAEDGGLIVEENGKRITLNSGEISVKM